jgi:hypothetical protein
MELPSLLTLDAIDRAIGDFLVGLAIQRHPDRKAAGCFISNDLNAANGLAPRPLSNSLQALPSESPVAQSDRLRPRHTTAVKVSRLGWQQLSVQAKPAMSSIGASAMYGLSMRCAPKRTWQALLVDLDLQVHASIPSLAKQKPPAGPGREVAGAGIVCCLGCATLLSDDIITKRLGGSLPRPTGPSAGVSLMKWESIQDGKPIIRDGVFLSTWYRMPFLDQCGE